MTIRFKNNSIEFESGPNKWILVETDSGFDFTGAIRAQEFLNFANIGLTKGYTSGGDKPGIIGPDGAAYNTIDSFPFATLANATDVGDLTVTRRAVSGASSTTHGYTTGGFRYPPSPGIAAISSNVIDRFPFAVNSNASDVGDLTVARDGAAGQTSSTTGYTSGGIARTAPGSVASNVIDSYPFASAAVNASDVGDLTSRAWAVVGQSSGSHGYTSGGSNIASPTPVLINVIDRFPFASNANSSDVGDLTTAKDSPAGQNSLTHGYNSGGSASTVIEKFLFATTANSSFVANLTQGRNGAGQSSTGWGYTSGGYGPINTIDRFPFASDANASDVGDLTIARGGVAGQQV